MDPSLRERAVAALCAPDLAPIVDLVVWCEDGRPHAANHLGRVSWNHDDTRAVLFGRDPIGSEDPLAFLPYSREVALPSPAVSTENAYPHAARRLRSFFADPDRSPDLAIMHTPRHFFPEEGGNPGEHGSLDAIQSRAPLLLSGPGVTARGLVDDHARLVDVCPTLAVLSGVPATDLVDADGATLDGRALTAYLTGERPRFVVGVLWDGAPSGDLLHLAEAGELPAVARLLERGTALRGGAVAEFPSITLTNHTAILTGLGPGRHGVLGNVYFDRASGERVMPNDESTWHRSAEWLRPAVRTVFEMVGEALGPSDSGGGPRTASVNEAIDRGADYSTMGLIRAGATGGGSLDDALPDATASAFVRNPAFLDDGRYRWGVSVDDIGLDQVLDLFADPATAPRLTWWAHVLTDAAHHSAGPRSEMARDSLRQSDARLGRFLDHLAAAGILDQTAFLLTADHGFEGADPTVTGSWRAALDGLGVPYRDEGPGLVYFSGPQ